MKAAEVQSAHYDVDLMASAETWSAWAASQVPQIEAVCVGGSRAERHGIVDVHSDLDLFIYSSEPLTEQHLHTLGVEPKTIRRRINFVEARTAIGGVETGIKARTVQFISTLVLAQPSLDPQYLEEWDCVLESRVLCQTTPSIAELQQEMARRKTETVAGISDWALDRFGKSFSWAATQHFVRRTDWNVVASNLENAVQALLLLHYLSTGEIPPSQKWRAAPSRMSRLPRGTHLADLLADWYRPGSRSEPIDRFRLVHQMELVVADGYKAPPWAHYKDDKWWIPAVLYGPLADSRTSVQ